MHEHPRPSRYSLSAPPALEALMWLFLLSFAHAAVTPGLPLRAISYEVDVSGSVAEIRVRQTFHAEGDQAIEATYTFPLQADAAVDGMRMLVGDRVIECEIRDREAAKQIYAEALSTGHLAALTEQERPNVFTQRVGNIPPGADVEVELRVIVPVLRREGAWELVIPLVVAPRFIPAGAPDAAALEKTYTTGDSGIDVDIDVAVHAGLAIRRIESPTHEIHATLDGDDADAKLADIRPSRDFVLRWWTASDAPQVGLLVNGSHALLTFEPPERSSYAERVPRELMFVLDQSCSMTGEPLNMAKEAMSAALDQLDPRDSFQVASFSDELDTVWRHSRPATPRNLRIAQRHVRRLDANGGTQMLPAMAALLKRQVDPQRHRVVVLLTDGQISNDDDVIAAIAAHPEATVATIGIGSSPNRYLLDELALTGGGASAYVTLDEAPEVGMRHMLEVMDRPVLTEATVDWGAWSATAMYPTRLPDLRAGQPVVVVARVDPAGSGPVRVTGRVGSGSFTQIVQPERVEAERALATTFARQKVADIHRRKLRGEIKDERPEVLATALEYHILTDYTAFVAIQWDRVANPGGRPKQVDQLLELPDGQTFGLDQLSGLFDLTGVNVASGRRYLSVVQSAAGFASFDPRPDPRPSLTPRALDEALELGNNSWRGLVRLSGSHSLEGEQGAAAVAQLSGPILRNLTWFSAGYSGELMQVPELSAQRQEVFGTVSARPTSKHHVIGAFVIDPVLVQGSSRYGGPGGSLRWQQFYNPQWMGEVWGAATRDHVAGDQRDHQQAVAHVRTYQLQDGVGSRHDLNLALSVDRLRWADGPLEAHAAVAAVAAEDSVARSDLVLRAGYRGAMWLAEDRQWLNSPYLNARWAIGPRTDLTVGASRRWDELRAVAPTRADRAFVELRRDVTDNLSARAEVSLRGDQLPFAPPPERATLEATLAAPLMDQRALGSEIGLYRTWGGGWRYELHWVWSHPFELDEALLAQPAAIWVPELIDVARSHHLSGATSWDVDLDEVALEVGLNGAWASAIAGPSEAWWLDPAVQAGAELEVSWPRRWGTVEPGVSATWASNTPATSLLPLEVLAVEPGAPEIDALPPWLFRAWVDVDF